MLIFPSNKAFGRHERIGIIGLIKQVVREKNLNVRMLVSVENLETSQELVTRTISFKRKLSTRSQQQYLYKIYCETTICRLTRNNLNSR